MSLAIVEHQKLLRACSRCPDMIAPIVVGEPVAAEILLVGQAPGDKEPKLGRPFAWTAGKQLFKWFASIVVDEATFRQRVYIAAVCRCFPGKNPKGGDRVPTPDEIGNCAPWLDRELALLRPKLVIPVGKLAIAQFIEPGPLIDQIGKLHAATRSGQHLEVLPLPHPSGASTWHRMEPGKSLLHDALGLLSAHPAWRRLLRQDQAAAAT